MREIEFRGKSLNTGKWVYGELRQDRARKKAYIEYEIDPETVGQYVGLKDRDGHKIFEGDILREIGRKEYAEETGIPEEELMNLPLEAEREVVVIYEAPRFVFAPNGYGYRFLNNPHLFRVVGNIHENPELK